jgi:hypothetical protein
MNGGLTKLCSRQAREASAANRFIVSTESSHGKSRTKKCAKRVANPEWARRPLASRSGAKRAADLLLQPVRSPTPAPPAHVIESSSPRQKARSKDCRESSKNSASPSLQPGCESAPQPLPDYLTTKGPTK